MGKVSFEVDEILKGVEELTIARELLQYVKGKDGKEQMPMPAACEQKAPERINMYSDGSVRNGRGQHWKVGGFGVWWPKDPGDKKPQRIEPESN